jgi:hypothetical protein
MKHTWQSIWQDKKYLQLHATKEKRSQEWRDAIRHDGPKKADAKEGKAFERACKRISEYEKESGL